jgi:hypothetical protein
LPDLNSKESANIISLVKKINSQRDFPTTLVEELEIAVAKAFNVNPVFNLD